MNQSVFLETKDFAVTGEPFKLLYDAQRHMLITSPSPPDLRPYYESQEYISHTDAKESLVDKAYQLVKKFNQRLKARLVTKYAVSGRMILDFGAGTGDFVATMKKRGWHAEGVEPNNAARILAHKKNIHLTENLNGVSKQMFDVITLWHVLEHLPDLDDHIRRLKSLLDPSGALIIAVPNFESHDAKHYGKFWAAYDTPRHLWHFSQKSIQTIFEGHDMRIEATRPMPFDAFYVALLSERYKTGGRSRYIQGIYQGLLSNLRSLFTKEPSSRIYILRRHRSRN